MSTTTSTKQRLLSAAQGILAESGLAAVNSNAIVERAKVTPPTFYHYFKNKNRADKLKKQIEKIGRNAVVVSGDIISLSDVIEMKEKLYNYYKYIFEGEKGYSPFMKLESAITASLFPFSTI